MSQAEPEPWVGHKLFACRGCSQAKEAGPPPSAPLQSCCTRNRAIWDKDEGFGGGARGKPQWLRRWGLSGRRRTQSALNDPSSTKPSTPARRKGGLSAAPGPAGSLRFVLRPARPGLRVHPPARSCGPACHSARSRRPANTSGLSHELLSQAFETRGRLGPGPVQQVWAGPPSLARRLRASPGARGAPGLVGRVSLHHPRSVRAPDNVAPSPSSPARRLSLRNSGWRTLALPLGGNRAGPAAGCPAPAPARPPRPGREATSPAAEWKPVRQVTNRWVVTVISQRMRRRSPGHSKLISSDHPLPAPATNTHRREPIKREPVRPASTLRLRERPRGTPVAPGDASPPAAAPGCRGPHWDRRTQQLRRAETGARRPGHGLLEEREALWLLLLRPRSEEHT